MQKSAHSGLRNALFESDQSKSLPESSSTDETNRRGQLLNARREMETELKRMRSTAAVIEESSKTIGSVNDKYALYSSSLAKASKTLKALKTKMENDDKYIYYSFVFFLCVSGYVFLKRVKIIAITGWFASKFYSLTTLVSGPDSNVTLLPVTTNRPTEVMTTHIPSERPMMAPTNSTKGRSPRKPGEEL